MRRLVSRARLLASVRLGGLLASLSIGCSVVATQVHSHYPIDEWLFWHHAVAGLCALLWALACCAMGYRLLELLRPAALLPLERAVFAFGLGTLSFALSVFLIGLGGGFGPACFFGVPLVFSLAGAGPVRRSLARGRRHLLPRLPARFATLRVRDFAALAAGLVGLLFSYAMVLHPGNVHFDARWYHLALAEHYVAAAGIEPTPEGWFLSAYPQLATLIYTWAFQLPASTELARVALAAHLELIVFVGTLAVVPAVVRRVLRRRVPLAWVATFLFPGLFLYGTGLHVNAERFAALFDALGCLALFVTWRSFSPRGVVLTAVCFGGALLTKHAALSIALAPVLAVALRGLWLMASRGGAGTRQALVALSWATAAGLLVTAPPG